MKAVPFNTIIDLMWSVVSGDIDACLCLRVRAALAIGREFVVGCQDEEAFEAALAKMEFSYANFKALCVTDLTWPLAAY